MSGRQLVPQRGASLYICWLQTSHRGAPANPLNYFGYLPQCLASSWFASEAPVCIATGCRPHTQVPQLPATFTLVTCPSVWPAAVSAAMPLSVLYMYVLAADLKPRYTAYRNCLNFTGYVPQCLAGSWFPREAPVCISAGCRPHTQVPHLSASEKPATHLNYTGYLPQCLAGSWFLSNAPFCACQLDADLTPGKPVTCLSYSGYLPQCLAES